MKLVIFEDASCEQFYPLTYLRPTFDLRCGSTLLREKVERAFGRKADVVFVREWLREAYAVRTSARVNDLGALAGDDLVLVNGRGLWIGDDFPTAGRDACAMAGAEIVYVTLTKQTAARIQASDFAGFLAAAAKAVPAARTGLKLLGYPWHLIEENGAAIRDDFKRIGRSGVHGTLGPSAVIWGPQNQVYVAPTAIIEPAPSLTRRKARSSSRKAPGSTRTAASRGRPRSAATRRSSAERSAKAPPSARSAASAARSRRASSTATATSTTTDSWATPTSASGSTSARSPPTAT